MFNIGPFTEARLVTCFTDLYAGRGGSFSLLLHLKHQFFTYQQDGAAVDRADRNATNHGLSLLLSLSRPPSDGILPFPGMLPRRLGAVHAAALASWPGPATTRAATRRRLSRLVAGGGVRGWYGKRKIGAAAAAGAAVQRYGRKKQRRTLGFPGLVWQLALPFIAGGDVCAARCTCVHMSNYGCQQYAAAFEQRSFAPVMTALRGLVFGHYLVRMASADGASMPLAPLFRQVCAAVVSEARRLNVLSGQGHGHRLVAHVRHAWRTRGDGGEMWSDAWCRLFGDAVETLPAFAPLRAWPK